MACRRQLTPPVSANALVLTALLSVCSLTNGTTRKSLDFNDYTKTGWDDSVHIQIKATPEVRNKFSPTSDILFRAGQGNYLCGDVAAPPNDRYRDSD